MLPLPIVSELAIMVFELSIHLQSKAEMKNPYLQYFLSTLIYENILKLSKKSCTTCF